MVREEAKKLDVQTSPTVVHFEDIEVEDGICEYEARVRAFMRMLRVKEETSGEGGYTMLFTNAHFTTPPYNKGMDTHPKKRLLLENTHHLLPVHIKSWVTHTMD